MHQALIFDESQIYLSILSTVLTFDKQYQKNSKSFENVRINSHINMQNINFTKKISIVIVTQLSN